ncbi:MAG: AbrB/MazE/SpoVT family DNA-binding domain-containing protein [Anaerolineales bacterium]|nr:AbrB/MazE/SpoVT family DNA-binding domain-containing protein [Anaerolineales bacterium]MCW5887882.1 AbrB/MazE/SpoVT family DNA-binding domain-containing protein [Anaerolineales bacterium]
MTSVKVSPKFQIVIPKAIRKSLGIKPGQTVRVIQYGDRIELIPQISIAEARGLYKGIDTDVDREPDRE